MGKNEHFIDSAPASSTTEVTLICIAEFDKKLDTLRKKRYAQDQKNGTLSKADIQKSVSYLGTNHILRNHF